MNTTVQWPWETPEPGLYFNMSFEEYLAIPALSNSGIKDLLVSGPNFWAQSWINPFKKPREIKEHHAFGTAYHCRIFEGKAVFDAQYAPMFEDDGNPDIFRTIKAMDEYLTSVDYKGRSKLTPDEKKAVIKDADPSAVFLSDLIAAHEKQYPKAVEFLPALLIREIELAAKSIEYNKYLAPWVSGGYPEVVCIFDYLGCRFKVRFDYLKIGSITDGKTFANEKGREIEKAIDYAIAGNKYFIQPAIYLPGADAARQFVKEGKYADLKVGNGTVYHSVDEDWLNAFAETPVTDFNFLFVQKGQALVNDGKIYSRQNEELIRQGDDRVHKAVNIFKQYYQTFGNEIWVKISPPTHIDFASLPAFAGDL